MHIATLPRAVLALALLAIPFAAQAGDSAPQNAAITTQQELDQALAKATTPVLVDFHATWCGPCHQLSAEIEKLQKDHPGALTVVTVDVDQANDLARTFNIEALPTLVLAKQGKVIKRQVGFVTAPELATWAGIAR